ncbi:MAG: hypothetical protein J1F35_07155 [Erysipelotrichales bacterium]|nr:hypothetical protein [Erysipelotrichales bacterium]
MKNILILGPGRAGKSTLSRMLKEKIPNYNLIHTDAIRNAIQFNLPCEYVEEFLNYKENNFFQKVLLNFLSEQSEQDKNSYGVILEGAQILPETLSNYSDIDNTIVIYIGHGKLSKKELFELVRKNDTEKDWSFYKTDVELEEYINEFYEKHLYLKQECEKYGFNYIDTSNNRSEILNELVENILKQI